MTYPTAAVNTTNVDASGDSPASARSDILDAIQKLNQMIAHTSAFAATLLDDANAATARGTLGAAASGANTDITSLQDPAIGAATATTQAASDNTTKVATTAMVQAALVSTALGGPGQSNQSFASPARKIDGTTYTNSTGRPIFVKVAVNVPAGGIVILSVGSVQVEIATNGSASFNYTTVSYIVPNNATYQVGTTYPAGTFTWMELR